MMKIFKRITATVLSLLLVFSLQMFSIVAHAVGVGTKENPYWITTADELQNINEDVTAHYVLKADIDLCNVDFTPIGNATSGAFSGSFDGNGYTISNLNVFSGKYAGLFGCNEGTVKNVKLSDIFVYGTRYVGGVVGQNTSLGTVENCTVLSGDVESDGGLNAVNVGGVCGFNDGTIKGEHLNSANVTAENTDAKAYAGGLIGYTNQEFVMSNSKNTGIVSSNEYAGGLIGYSRENITIENCKNSGSVSTSNSNKICYSGGLIGYTNKRVTILDSSNCGNISVSETYYKSYSGGLIGKANNDNTSDSDVIIENSKNIGNVYSSCSESYYYSDPYSSDEYIYCYSGGLIGSCKNVIVKNSYNSGDISSFPTFFCDYSWSSHSCEMRIYAGGLIGTSSGNMILFENYNLGKVYCDSNRSQDAYSYSGGLIGYKNDNSDISNNLNSGVIYTNGEGRSAKNYSGGLIGFGNNNKISNSYNISLVSAVGKSKASGGLIGSGDNNVILNCYNAGNLSTNSGGLINSGNSNTLTNSYSNQDLFSGSGKNGILLTSSQMKSQSNYISWDFNDVWTMDGNINNGFPVLKDVSSPLQFDIVSTTMCVGESLQLMVYKNGVVTSDVTWSVSYGNIDVSNSGKITATEQGLAAITATDSDGNKANCNIYVMTPNTSVSLNDFSVNKGSSYSQTISLGISGSGDFITEATSSDSSVLDINSFGGITIYGTAHEPGTVIINFKTAQGFTGSCTATVTNYATNINVSSSLSVNRGESKQIALTTTPDDNSSVVTWTSLNPSIATVDQNGFVTGVSPGSTTITVTTDNGLSRTCTVNVYVPMKSLAFTDNLVILEQGQTYQTSIIKDPVDTTDSISYTSSASSSRLSVNGTGLITAGTSYTGTYTITATASSGVKAYLEVVVVEKRVNPTEISLNNNDKTMILGDDFDLIPTLSPSNASADITYSSDDESVATVDENGNVEAVGEGTTIIRVKTSNGLTTSCVVTVYGFTKVNGVDYFDIYALEDFIIFRDFVNKSAENTSTNARLMVDLDLSSVCSDELGSFTPIGSVNSPYNGIFDGNGHKIKNLYIDSTAYSGLFGYIGADGKVCNLVLDNVLVAGTNYVGGIAGKSEGVIEKTTVSGIVFGASYVGGIVGSNTGAINYCGNTAEVLGTSIVGGITGDSTSTGTISNCYSASEITASDYRQGGLCGMNYGAISNSYYDNTLFTGSVVGRGNSENCENSAKPSTSFEGGEVTYVLNADLENVVFYQTLGTDPYPILNNKHNQVYFGFENCNSGKEVYTNNVVSPERPNHNFVDDVCTICGVKNTTIVIREQSFIEGLIYGSHSVEWLESELENMDEITAEDIYIEVYDFEGMQLLDNSYHVGTASTVYVYDSNTDELINMYTVVLYGDVNGDGIIDELDTDVIKDLALSTSEQEPVGNWKWFLMAADTNHDGAVDGFDVIETELQVLDMHVIEQKNTLAYLPKDEVEEETDTIQE